jgi:thiol-disulfide isomerase/thioredoxin
MRVLLKRCKAVIPTIALGLSMLTTSGWAEPESDLEPLVFEDMNGGRHVLDQILSRGQNVVFVFWQTWCSSCKSEAAALAEAVDRHGDSISFFGVVSGPDRVVDDGKVRATATSWGLRHTQIPDRDLLLTHRYKVEGTPVIVVIGENRRVLFRGNRLPEDWTAYLGRRSQTRSEVSATGLGAG